MSSGGCLLRWFFSTILADGLSGRVCFRDDLAGPLEILMMSSLVRASGPPCEGRAEFEEIVRPLAGLCSALADLNGLLYYVIATPLRDSTTALLSLMGAGHWPSTDGAALRRYSFT
jgi:hypothetical protein